MIEIRFTENLTANLRNVETFWDENQFAQGFDRLVDELTDSVVPILKRHPRMGRNFLQRQPRSVDAVAHTQKAGTKRWRQVDTEGSHPLTKQLRQLVQLWRISFAFDNAGNISLPLPNDLSPFSRIQIATTWI